MSEDKPETEEVDVYFNPELPADFEKLVKLMQETDELLLTVSADMQVAKPDDDTLLEFGGYCLEAHEAIENITSLVKKTRKLLKKLEEESDGEWHVITVEKRDDLHSM